MEYTLRPGDGGSIIFEAKSPANPTCTSLDSSFVLMPDGSAVCSKATLTPPEQR